MLCSVPSAIGANPFQLAQDGYPGTWSSKQKLLRCWWGSSEGHNCWLDIWGQEAALGLSAGRRGLMEKVSFQVQLTGRPYLILKLPEDCCDRKSSPSRLGEESATLLYARSHLRKSGVLIPFQRHGVQYFIPRFDG